MLFSRLPNEGNSEGSNADLKRKSTIKASIPYFLKINHDQKLVKLINRIKPLQFDKLFSLYNWNLHISVSTEQRVSSSYHRGWWHWVILQNPKLPTELGWRLLAGAKPTWKPTSHSRIETWDCRDRSWTTWWSHQRWPYWGWSDTATTNSRIKAHGSRICCLRTWRSWRNGCSRQLCKWGTRSVQILQWAHADGGCTQIPVYRVWIVVWGRGIHVLCPTDALCIV